VPYISEDDFAVQSELWTRCISVSFSWRC